MLSIQYVYERVFYSLFAFRFHHNDCSGKRLQKYNFFLNSQAFFKKISFLFFKPFSLKTRFVCLKTTSAMNAHPRGWDGKDTTLFLYHASFFFKFF